MKMFGSAKFLIQDLTTISLLILLMLLSLGCATLRHEPKANEYPVLVRLVYMSGGCLEYAEGITIYRNRNCRIKLGVDKVKWFKISEDEYSRIEKLLNQDDFTKFYGDSRNRVLDATEIERIYISLENDPESADRYTNTPIINLEDKSRVPPSIISLIRELRIAVIGGVGVYYWYIN